jgi:hypothetical protein
MKNIKIGEYYKIWEDLRKRRKLSTSFLQLQHIHFYIFPNITFTPLHFACLKPKKENLSDLPLAFNRTTPNIKILTNQKNTLPLGHRRWCPSPLEFQNNFTMWVGDLIKALPHNFLSSFKLLSF